MTELIVEELQNENGPVLMVRGTDPAAIFEAARLYAHEIGLALSGGPEDVKVVPISELPCDPDGHELLNGGWCSGDYASHYEPVGANGQFMGAFFDDDHLTDGPLGDDELEEESGVGDVMTESEKATAGTEAT